MRGRWRAVVVGGLSVLMLAIAGCTGGGEADPRPAPEPTEATPTGPPPQPEGADGVTWEIQNWDEYAEDEAVLAWKQFNEAVAASITNGEFLPAARDLSTAEVLADYSGSVDFAAANDYRSQRTTDVSIVDSTTDSGVATVVACVWSKSVELVASDGEYVSDEDPQWLRQEADVELGSDSPVVTRVEYEGTCDDDEPPPRDPSER